MIFLDMYAERTEKNASQKDKTGIPRRMKAGFERSSGFSFNDVKVHYNSDKPAQLRAHAYTQGNDVYVAPGQEKHLPHELGHVVQQKRDTVRPTGTIGGLPLNDDKNLENGADMIAAKAQAQTDREAAPIQGKFENGGIVQRMDFASERSYNLFAGPVSGIAAGLGVLGGILGFVISRHNEKKRRYVDQIEKYADLAEEAGNEAEAFYYKMKNANGGHKLNYAIATKKYARKAILNNNIVKKKFKTDYGMKNSENAISAKKRAHKAASNSRKYIQEADPEISDLGIHAPPNRDEDRTGDGEGDGGGQQRVQAGSSPTNVTRQGDSQTQLQTTDPPIPNVTGVIANEDDHTADSGIPRDDTRIDESTQGSSEEEEGQDELHNLDDQNPNTAGGT